MSHSQQEIKCQSLESQGPLYLLQYISLVTGVDKNIFILSDG